MFPVTGVFAGGCWCRVPGAPRCAVSVRPRLGAVTARCARGAAAEPLAALAADDQLVQQQQQRVPHVLAVVELQPRQAEPAQSETEEQLAHLADDLSPLGAADVLLQHGQHGSTAGQATWAGPAAWGRDGTASPVAAGGLTD